MRTSLLRSAALAALAGSALLVSACRDRQEAAETDAVNAAEDFTFEGMNDQSALEMAGDQAEDAAAGNAAEPSPVVANTIGAPTPPGAPGGDTGGNTGDDDPSGM